MTVFETIIRDSNPVKLELLAEGKVGARLATYNGGVQAIVKIASSATMKKHRETQRGLPTRTFPRREVAFYRLCRVLREYDDKFDVVPETVLGSFEGYPASFQQYVTSAKLVDIDHRLRKPRDKEMWAIAFRETLRDRLPPSDSLCLTVLDFLACSRDRHASNYGARLKIDADKAKWRLIGWDNGCSFGLTQENYHCVAHKHLFRFAMDLESVWKALQKVRRSELIGALGDLLSSEIIDHVWMRFQFINMFPHRMPWVTLSKGNDNIDSFPTYAEFFKPLINVSKPLYILQSA